LHTADSMQRLAYSLAAGLLGRLCLSGEIDLLSAAQWEMVQSAIDFYELVAPIIKNGKSCLFQHIGAAWRHPQGAQAVFRISASADQALVVVHTFAAPLPDEIVIPLPEGNWQISQTFPNISASIDLTAHQLRIKPVHEFEGFALHLTT